MSTLQDQVRDAIQNGVNYLAKKQQKNGSFLSLSSPNPHNFDKTLKFHSVFSTSLILGCLNNLKETNKIKLIKQKCASFLLSQKSQTWSFNYWARGSKEAKLMPYPDDLDDTFCALSAFFGFNQNLIDGEVLADVVNLLTYTEIATGGPYRTWLVPADADDIWKDVDLAVNSNIAYFLSLQDISLPNLNKFIASKIKQLESPYYPSIYPLVYFIARFSGQNKRYSSNLRKLLFRKQQEGRWENPLDTALATSALLYLGISFQQLTPIIDYLLSQQNLNGDWDAFAFCLDPALSGKKHYSGSPVLTTAFCLESLQKYLDDFLKQHFPVKRNILNKEDSIYGAIMERIRLRLVSLDKDLQNQALDSLENTLNKENKKQVVLLPYYFKLAMKVDEEKVSDELIIQLGMANLYGWLSYTIYDNFLDDEGTVEKLSVANLALRELITILTNLLPDTKFNQFFKKVMDKLENANTWEVSHCRVKISGGKINLKDFKIPDYGNLEKLEERSLGHSLTPIATLFALGFSAKSKEVKSLFEFFKHYLIARQLNDDAHDWEKDLRMGHINAVGALLLKEYPIRTAVSVSSIIPKLQQIFWYKIIVKVSHRILKNTKLAKKSLKQCSVVSDYTLADRLLGKIEAGAKLALKERENTIKFLSSYKLSRKDL
ncbi:hypothetical protein HYT18_01115 [Candidatus Microgenomates bacterium]|nr:hypothetical protein [Candidatus Microgenomates bacterium]